MPVYEVRCMECGKSSLHEHVVPLEDPGTLPAFCSLACAKTFGRARLAEIYPEERIVELPCGCLVGVDAAQMCTPFPACNGGADPFGHIAEIVEAAQREVREREAERN